MRLRKAIPTGLALLLAASVLVCGAPAGAKAAPAAKAAAGSKPAKARSRTRHSRRRERGQNAPTPERISEIQQALAKDGAFAGNPNGKWDASTIQAMRKFQESHGLNPTGKLDALTLQKLGLGSKTAGVAAPIPTASSSSTPSLLTGGSEQTSP
jgi:peptidoglycan hydrolase-like protein with peptidoglycan-binding domain